MTMRLPLFQVDAFTHKPFAGNPAAVCLLDSWLDDQLLGKVTQENNLSETAFLVPRGDLYELRWFTPRSEVKLCGHATLASGYVVLNLLRPGLSTVRFETRRSGILTVSKESNSELLAMDFPALVPKSCASPPDALFHGLGPGSIPSKVLAVDEKYIAVYEMQSTIQKIRPDFARLEQLHPVTVSVTAPGQDADFVSRYFAPSYGIPEDPVTGSAHCALTPYWSERLGKTHLHARQLSERGGELWCEMAGERVILKGSGVLTVEGSFLI